MIAGTVWFALTDFSMSFDKALRFVSRGFVLLSTDITETREKNARKPRRSIRSDRYIPLNKNFVEAYELIDDVDDKKRDVLNAMWRGGIGQMIFGTAGGVGGALLAKTRDEGYKIVAVQFRNGKQSLIRLDQKAWEQFLADCFCSPDYVPEPIERPKLTRAFQVGRCILSLALLAAIVWGLVKCTTGA